MPLLYRESGGIPEYCSGFGVSFTTENFERKLQEMVDTYDHWAEQMKDYRHTAERMGENYYRSVPGTHGAPRRNFETPQMVAQTYLNSADTIVVIWITTGTVGK